MPDELGPFGFSAKRPITIIACVGNTGAQAVAHELKVAAEEAAALGGSGFMGANPVDGNVKLELAEAVLQHGRGAPSYRAAMLLYLNKDTFLDAGGAYSMVKVRSW